MDALEEGVVDVPTGVKRYAFVLPRFGRAFAGGAEALARELAVHLAERGEEIEVWTTCAKDNRTWANELPAGVVEEDGVAVHRFPVDDRDLETWIPLQLRIHEGLQLTLPEQLDWMQESVNSRALYTHILQAADTVDAIFFAPYLFGTTFWGSMLRPDKSILIPCLHNETYAYTNVIQSMFRQVRGSLFNAVPEQDLASALYGTGRGGEVGMGFDLPDPSYVECLSPYFEEHYPYAIYIGRKETGKNVQGLIDAFVAGKENGSIAAEMKLVIAGGGSFDDILRPDAIKREDIVDVGFVSEEEKQRLIKHAVFLCQPSMNESFSIVLMEAWMVGTPVVVHGSCPVTRHHVVASGGGLYFVSDEDFQGVVGRLVTEPSLCKEMATAGLTYVAEQYNWSVVLDRFDAVMKELGVS